MREVTMELFGEQFTFKADDENADRLVDAMKKANQKRGEIQGAMQVLEAAGAEYSKLRGLTDPLTKCEVTGLMVECPASSRHVTKEERPISIHSATVTMPDGSEAKGYTRGGAAGIHTDF